MPRAYHRIMGVFSDPKRTVIRKRDGLFTEALKTTPREVEDSLDAEFGKRPKTTYRPHPIHALMISVLILMAPCLRAENAQLNSAIQGVSSQTQTLQGAVSTLGTDEAALIQRYHLTNAGKCSLLAVGISTGTPASTISISLGFLPSSPTITAVQADLTFSSSFTLTGATIGPVGVAAGKTVSTSAVNGETRILFFGFNTTPIGAGILATLSFTSLATTPLNIYPITLENLVASDANGNAFLLCGVTGALEVL